jgi:glycosyltransferase involved in cell wall biosynthesis
VDPSAEVLLVAFAISPSAGSESGAGWAILRAHQNAGHKVTLLTTDTRLAQLESLNEYKQHEVKGIGIAETNAFLRIQNFFPFRMQLRHIMWNIKIANFIKNYSMTNPKTIVHYATYAGDWNINVLLLLSPSIPKIWGPVGGAQFVPINLLTKLGPTGLFTEILKVFLGKLLRFVIAMRMRKSNIVILCLNQATFDTYSRFTKTRICQNIVLDQLLLDTNPYPRSSNLIFGCGRLIPLKNWKMAILAMKYVENKVLVLAGEGQDQKRLNKLVAKNRIEHKVKFIGKIERLDTIEYMKACDAFIFPSLRDSASWALAEAVALGSRVIALDLPGSTAITEGTGIKLVSVRQSNIVQEIAREIEYGTNLNSGNRKFKLSDLSIEMKVCAEYLSQKQNGKIA